MSDNTEVMTPIEAPKLTAHPRAQRHIRQAKGWGGILGLVLVVLASKHGGLPNWDAGLRGLMGGVVGYIVGWTVALQVWRHLAMAEIRAARAKLAAARNAQA